jgi:hypothetical protein
MPCCLNYLGKHTTLFLRQLQIAAAALAGYVPEMSRHFTAANAGCDSSLQLQLLQDWRRQCTLRCCNHQFDDDRLPKPERSMLFNARSAALEHIASILR